MIRKHIIISGNVQHVGFRYTCSGIAANCSVTGWIRNLYNGDVELEVQGAEPRVERFIETVKAGDELNRWIHISHMEITDIPPVNVAKEKRFSVRY